MQGRSAFKTYQHHTHVCVCLSVFEINFPSTPKRPRRDRHVCGSIGIYLLYNICGAALKTSLTCLNTNFLRYLNNIQNAKITTTTTHVEQGRATLKPTPIICMCGFFRLSEQGYPSLISFGPKIYLRRFHAFEKIAISQPCIVALKKNISQRIYRKSRPPKYDISLLS